MNNHSTSITDHLREASLGGFDHQPRTRIVFGVGQLRAISSFVEQLAARRVLIVSDPGIVAAGYPACCAQALQAARIECEVFSDIGANPTTEHVARGVEVAASFRPDLIIGLGGGSSMDCAKGVNFIYTNGGEIRDYWGIGKSTRPLLPMIAVPTTAGTGSEAQSFALISDAVTHVKMACGDPQAAFRVSLLDPELTLTQPPQVTSVTGMDAMAHALESFVCTRRNALSMAYAAEAWKRLIHAFPRVLENPQDLEARAHMQLGACLGGLAIENSMLGAAHALANPLTARFGVVHGQAVGMMLPHVIRFNGTVSEALYADFRSDDAAPVAVESATDWLAATISGLLGQCALPSRLRDLGYVALEDLPQLAADAAQQWTAGFNPRPVDEPALLQLYQQAY